MEGEPYDVVPCSSVTVDSILRIGTAGAIWGLCAGPHDARKQGLAGAAQVAFVARSAGRFGVQYGLVAGICTLTHCGLQRYRGKSDWVNGLVAGAVAGGAIAAMTRSWTQVIPMACLVSAFKVATDYARAV
ncbi:outer envelope pore protein 16-4 [Pyrus ussuriensis x Pyrus communis]|uniref:Outer envelope pore protein 16-4 n=1 Tax=Pyrus ussuriensis x Pyrus communis TaxID=2448454 RepID=A0A5N5FU15_9ROSA|nr:outer envelope pore protein 16-4 [Pyrus ussuriensis x Pyrus communis]